MANRHLGRSHIQKFLSLDSLLVADQNACHQQPIRGEYAVRTDRSPTSDHYKLAAVRTTVTTFFVRLNLAAVISTVSSLPCLLKFSIAQGSPAAFGLEMVALEFGRVINLVNLGLTCLARWPASLQLPV